MGRDRSEETNSVTKNKKLSLSSWILIGMAAGILAGMVFGEYVAFLDVIGNGFIRLLQMTILPYIFVSLILGIGGLTYAKARMMAVKAGILLLITWAIAFFFILVMPLAFPEWESASFYSNALVEVPEPVDFLSLYIPSNPFYSLSNNFVPAVVLFSIAVGVALIGIGDKERFLNDLAVVSKALVRVTGFVVRLTPLGVFAISASAAGTMSVDELSKLQVYVVTFTLASLVLAFWVLPAMVAVATPFRYKDLVGVSRDALLTAFTTGNLFVVLPILTENGKQLFERYAIKEENTDAYVDVIVPTSFNFPNIGKLIMLLFVLFAGWFSGNGLELEQYPQFVVSGLLSFFGGVDVALPFMLDQMHIPSDMYQLYVVTGIVNGRTATLLAAMNLLAFTLLATAALTGHMRIEWRKIAGMVVITLGLVVVIVGGSRLYFETAIDNAYDKDEVISSMQSLIQQRSALVYDRVPAPPLDADPSRPLLERILDRGVLRVGYFPRNMPFSYLNDNAELVGFDVEMAYLLADELGLTAQFVPLPPEELEERLADNTVDIVMSSVPATTGLLAKLEFSEPYLRLSLAFVTADYRRKTFESFDAIREAGPLHVGVFASRLDDYFRRGVEAFFPNVTMVELDEPETFFERAESGIDAILASAENGSAWTLLYPSFKVVVPKPDIVEIPIAYPVAQRDLAFARFVSKWIELKQGGILFRRLYDHWILGRNAEDEPPRWSVIRNVLHWVD